MNIIIKTRKQHPVTDEALYALMQQSYQQWRDAGIEAAWLHRTIDDFREVIRNTVVFLAVNTDDDSLLGMHCFNCYPKQHYAHGFYLAIAPQAKQQGIATRMLQYEEERFATHGYRHLQGVSKVSAIWSVRWHLKNGYRIVGYSISENSNCASYTFRKQIATDIRHHPSDILWLPFLAPIIAKISFVISYLISTISKTHSGQLNVIGRLAKRIWK